METKDVRTSDMVARILRNELERCAAETLGQWRRNNPSLPSNSGDNSRRALDEVRSIIDHVTSGCGNLRRIRFALNYSMGPRRLMDMLELPNPDQIRQWEDDGGTCSS